MEISATQTNAQLDMAYEFVMNTNRSVFLTGKAGTGKTTFLQRIKVQSAKRIAIAAPTGVAAINAGGVTIHSLFQLPFSPYIPDQNQTPGLFRPPAEARKFSKDKINLIKSIDLLVIDEISMVRCDLLDAVDGVLRQFRNRLKPFGGVQLLLIGDINQLAPVAREEEWELLRHHYETVFFFSSHSLKQSFPVIIELQHIFRQSDSTFIELLNKVRNNLMDQTSFELLNKRLDRNVFQNNGDEGYITLCTHNAMAKRINSDKLEQLKTESYFYQAIIKGNFPEYSYPTDEHLELKNGAQVMFIKNDAAKEKRYFNGKIGRITDISSEKITVMTDDLVDIEVGIEEWTNIKYTFNAGSKTIDEELIGSFRQFPLKLAYAITIHKSQGLTFDKVIIDAQAAFSSGQVYVALSRCRTLEGIILSTPISAHSIKSDHHIDKFNATMAKEIPDESRLEEARFQFQESLLMDLLDYEQIRKPLMYFHHQLFANSSLIDKKSIANVDEIINKSEKDIGSVMRNFQRQLREILNSGVLPEKDEILLERLKKGAIYFEEKFNTILSPLKDFYVAVDNKTVEESIKKALEMVNKAVFIQLQCFNYCSKEFSAIGYSQTKVNAEIDFDKSQSSRVSFTKSAVPKNVIHPELYSALRQLRSELASENDVEAYQIFHQKALLEIVNTLPNDFRALENIHGIGKVTSKKYGLTIIDVVKQYCEQKGIETPEIGYNEQKPKKKIGESPRESYRMFLLNPSVTEIAKERGLAESTINSHLAPYLEEGLLSIERFLTKEKIEFLTQFFTNNPELGTTAAKEQLGDDYSYSDLRFFLAWWRWKNSSKTNEEVLTI